MRMCLIMITKLAKGSVNSTTRRNFIFDQWSLVCRVMAQLYNRCLGSLISRSCLSHKCIEENARLPCHTTNNQYNFNVTQQIQSLTSFCDCYRFTWGGRCCLISGIFFTFFWSKIVLKKTIVNIIIMRHTANSQITELSIAATGSHTDLF